MNTTTGRSAESAVPTGTGGAAVPRLGTARVPARPGARPTSVSDETAGFAVVPAELRGAAADAAWAADAAQGAARELVAGLRALADAVPGTRAGPAAAALAATWEDEAARWVAGARRLDAALAATAAGTAAADVAAAAGLLAGDRP